MMPDRESPLCSCHPRASADGRCTEWTCVYHGRENERLQKAQRAKCLVHGSPEEAARS